MTPPSAQFVISQDDANFLNLLFTNQSNSATDYIWDFGDGATSTEVDPSHEYDTAGVYTITLICSDKLNVYDTTSMEFEITEPINTFMPQILNPGFDIEGDDAYRDHWRNGDLGGVIQITTSPVHDGERASKYPSAGDRIAYQAIQVQKNKEYIVSFYYTMKETPAGSLTVAILAGEVNDPALVAGATINSVTVNDQTDDGTYVLAQVTFNSGDNETVAVYVTNVDVECRVDTFSIVEN